MAAGERTFGKCAARPKLEGLRMRLSWLMTSTVTATRAQDPTPMAGTSHVIHTANGALWAGVAAVGCATASAAMALQDIRWLAGTFALLVLGWIAVWRWVSMSIVLGPKGIVIGRMFGLDRKLAYRDIARVRFIRVETGDADTDWQVGKRIEALGFPFETARQSGATPSRSSHASLLQLRIEPKASAAQGDVRLDLGLLRKAADIQALYDRLPQPPPLGASKGPIW